MAALAPLPAIGLIGNPEVVSVAKYADARLRAVLDEFERDEVVASSHRSHSRRGAKAAIGLAASLPTPTMRREAASCSKASAMHEHE